MQYKSHRIPTCIFHVFAIHVMRWVGEKIGCFKVQQCVLFKMVRSKYIVWGLKLKSICVANRSACVGFLRFLSVHYICSRCLYCWFRVVFPLNDFSMPRLQFAEEIWHLSILHTCSNYIGPLFAFSLCSCQSNCVTLNSIYYFSLLVLSEYKRCTVLITSTFGCFDNLCFLWPNANVWRMRRNYIPGRVSYTCIHRFMYYVRILYKTRMHENVFKSFPVT